LAIEINNNTERKEERWQGVATCARGVWGPGRKGSGSNCWLLRSNPHMGWGDAPHKNAKKPGAGSALQCSIGKPLCWQLSGSSGWGLRKGAMGAGSFRNRAEWVRRLNDNISELT